MIAIVPRSSVAVESPASPDAIALVAALDAYLLDLYPPEHNHLLSIDALLAPEVTFVVARTTAAAAGCGALLRHGRDFIEIKRMFVRPQFRGHRIGDAVLRFLEQLGLHEGYRLAKLETGVRQPEALRLFERAGYRPAGPFGGYAENGTSVFLERTLGVAP